MLKFKLFTLIFVTAGFIMAQEAPDWMDESVENLKDHLIEKYGTQEKQRIDQGLIQVAQFWREQDGNRETFEQFVMTHFAGDQQTRDEMFERFQYVFEKIDGHMTETILALRWQTDLDIGKIYPFDRVLAGYDPSAHINDDFFNNKIAFIVLLNFPLSTLQERLNEGDDWTRRQWAETRLAQRFSKRIPAEVNQAISEAGSVADQYIADYNIWMHHLLNDKGERLFPEGLRLLSHWNLRDEIKAQYSAENGLPKQMMIQKVMERIVTQTIPEVVVNNPFVDWNPYTNEVKKAAVNDSGEEMPTDLKVSDDPEPDTRYEVLLGTFLAAKKVDPYSPNAPTHIQRSFDEGREMPEKRVREIFEKVLSSPARKQMAALIEKRLGRKLQPFDIWYNGFRPRGTYTEQQLDEITTAKYPTAQAFEDDMVNILTGLDFPEDRARYLAANIEVDPARGSGHAWGSQMREANARLRTRVGKDGMDYKGYNIAVHELGHNVEQTFSLKDIDYTLLEGVPNTAFTEALAFVFQERDMELLGLAKMDEQSRAYQTLDAFWGTCEIAAVALVDMQVWHWMYDNPDATPAQLRKATINISKETWNKYFADIFNQKDVVLLGIYSHMIHSFLYLPNYPLGHLIAQQVKERMYQAGKIGPEFERVCKIGNVTPDLWMQEATGDPVSADPMLRAVNEALKKLK